MSNETIFVIDDDQDLRESIIEILGDNGFTAIGCESAEVALQKMKTELPILVVVDNMMPGIGGMAFISLIRNDYPSIKIIMITAFSTVDNAVAAMKSGADDYLAKPFKRADLLTAVKRNLETLKFERQQLDPDMNEALSCLANPIRRQILKTLSTKREMRFMDLTRYIGISDHTKVNFHLKNLKSNHLISRTREKGYHLTPQGEKMANFLNLFSKNIS
jgi:DNA-binding NtrC family response regulator